MQIYDLGVPFSFTFRPSVVSDGHSETTRLRLRFLRRFLSFTASSGCAGSGFDVTPIVLSQIYNS